MKPREKVMAVLVGSIVLVGGGAYGIHRVVVKPLKDADRQIADLKGTLSGLNDERRAFFTNEAFFKDVAKHTFGRDADAASAQVGKMITDQLMQLGLSEQAFTRTPFGPRKMKGAQEIGWNVQGEGPQAKMIDLMFTLDQVPQIHRLDNLVVSVGDKPGRLKARFRYLTLVVDAVTEATKVELKPRFALDSAERQFYSMITERDILRPYIKRRFTRPDPASQAPSTDSNAKPAIRTEQLKVVSLTLWGGVPEVHICDLNTMKITRYQLGDELAGGRIVMIDYRSLPMPGKPELFSNSRLILKIGTDYWAVEEGQLLGGKYQLPPETLPPDLPKN